MRSGFEDLLAKYKKKRASQKQGNRSNINVERKSPQRHEKQPVYRQRHHVLLLDRLHCGLARILINIYLGIFVVCT